MKDLSKALDDTYFETSASRPSSILMAGLLTRFIWFDQALQNSFEARGFPRVSRSESQVIVLAANGVKRPTDIAKTLGFSRQAVNQTLKSLIKRKLITLEPDPTDGRCLIVTPSLEGLPIVRSAMNILDHLECYLREIHGDEKLDVMLSMFQEDWGPPPTFPK